jgi:hypothetical protein
MNYLYCLKVVSSDPGEWTNPRPEGLTLLSLNKRAFHERTFFLGKCLHSAHQSKFWQDLSQLYALSRSPTSESPASTPTSARRCYNELGLGAPTIGKETRRLKYVFL